MDDMAGWRARIARALMNEQSDGLDMAIKASPGGGVDASALAAMTPRSYLPGNSIDAGVIPGGGVDAAALAALTPQSYLDSPRIDLQHLIRPPMPVRAKRPYDDGIGRWAVPQLNPYR